MEKPIDKINWESAKGTVGGLAEVLEALGAELRSANERIRESGAAPVIALSDAEVELNLRLEADGRGGVRFWVIEATGGLVAERTATVRVRLFSTSGMYPVGA